MLSPDLLRGSHHSLSLSLAAALVLALILAPGSEARLPRAAECEIPGAKVIDLDDFAGRSDLATRPVFKGTKKADRLIVRANGLTQVNLETGAGNDRVCILGGKYSRVFADLEYADGSPSHFYNLGPGNDRLRVIGNEGSSEQPVSDAVAVKLGPGNDRAQLSKAGGYIEGGPGRDRLLSLDPEPLAFIGQGDDDRLDAAGISRPLQDPTRELVPGGRFIFAGGGGGDDRFDFHLLGAVGNPWVISNARSLLVIGDEGDDQAISPLQTSATTFLGRAGSDDYTASASWFSIDTFAGGAGNDLGRGAVKAVPDLSSLPEGQTPDSGLLALNGQEGNDRLVDDARYSRLEGEEGDDHLSAGSSDGLADILNGGAGNDTCSGLDAKDQFDGCETVLAVPAG